MGDSGIRALTTRLRKEGHVVIECTGWLDGASAHQVEQLYAEFRERCNVVRVSLETEYGAPQWSIPGDDEWFAAWYPEAFAGAAWRIDGRYLCLAAEHHDQETPVALVLRSLTEEDLLALRG